MKVVLPVIPSELHPLGCPARSHQRNPVFFSSDITHFYDEHEIQKRETENQKQLSTKTDIGWGHQIRSYILQPYQLVKDLRNKVENTNPTDVLNGNIDEFINAGIVNK